jgi:glycosyltransferase involved in cell wall biosynthesis
MTVTFRMHLAYLTDQLLPQNATDTTQLVSMAASFDSVLRQSGGRATIVAPSRWTSRSQNAESIATYYSVEPGFEIDTVKSVYPFIRGIEKLAQGWRAPSCRTAQKADVLYTRTLPILLGALVLNAGPIVYETYRPWPVQNPYSHTLFRWIGSHPLFLGAVLHSEYARKSYLEVGLSSERLITAHNGYAPEQLTGALTKEEARATLGWSQGLPVAVYSGRINERKGLDVVLEMAGLLPDIRFVLVGSEGQGHVEKAAADMPNVQIIAWSSIPETLPYLYAADVLLIPPSLQPLTSAGNTVLPIKTFQYLAAGRPILAGRTPDLTEILSDGINARLVPPDNAVQAAIALTNLFSDQSLQSALSGNALETVKNLTWEKRARKILSFVEERMNVKGQGRFG